MGYPLTLALRYMGSKKRASISVGTAIAVLGVMLGVAALLTVMSVTGGFQAEFRDKVLGVNAHVLVLKHSTEFRNYREVMEQVRGVKGVLNVAPFSINPMMLAHGEKTATGVLLKGVDPKASLGVDLEGGVPPVLDLPRHVYAGEAGTCPAPVQMDCGIGLLRGLRREGAAPPSRKDIEPPPAPTSDSDGGAGVEESDGGAPDWLRKEMRDREKAPKGSPPPLPDDDVIGQGGGFGAAPGDLLDDRKPEEKKADKKKADAKKSDEKSPEEKADEEKADEELGEGGGTGDVTPDGGYKSQLPDDDELPAGIETDECDDPELVKKLPGIVIGKSLAETLKLEIGGCVTVTSPTIGFQFSGGAVKPAVAKRFRVMALFEAGFDQYDSKLVYTDLYEAQVFYDEGDTVTGVEMKIADIEKSDEVVDAVKKVVPPASYRTMDWKELNRGLFAALLIQKVMMSGVLALIILIAAFTVVATLIMVVLDKKKEISVLKAMGATDTAVLRIFLYQGLFIGGLGTSLGLLLGYGVCESLVTWAFPLDPKVYFIDHLPVLLRADEFMITGGVAIALCLVGTALPSLYAASLLPADGLRDIQGGSSGIEAGEVLRSGWEVMRTNWPILLLVPAVGYTVGSGISFFVPFLGFVGLLIRPIVLGVYATAARGEDIGLLDHLARGGRRAVHVALVDLARSLGMIALFAISLLPGYLISKFTDHETVALWTLIACVGAALAVIIVVGQATRLAPYFAADQGLDVVSALRSSWRATEGRRTDCFIYDVVGIVVILLSLSVLCVGALLALAVVTAGDAVIYTRLARAVAPPRRQASIPDGAVTA